MLRNLAAEELFQWYKREVDFLDLALMLHRKDGTKWKVYLLESGSWLPWAASLKNGLVAASQIANYLVMILGGGDAWHSYIVLGQIGWTLPIWCIGKCARTEQFLHTYYMGFSLKSYFNPFKLHMNKHNLWSRWLCFKSQISIRQLKIQLSPRGSTPFTLRHTVCVQGGSVLTFQLDNIISIERSKFDLASHW